jgi:phosphoribosyl-ATP pyrophosphohydrolase
MNEFDVLSRLNDVILSRKISGDDESSYVSTLFARGQDQILKKISEEAAEVIMASKDDNADAIIKEVADLWFHSLIVLAYHQVSAKDVAEELANREGLSGIQEKLSRPK